MSVSAYLERKRSYPGWPSPRCRTFRSDMLQYEADLKKRRYFGCDIPNTPVLLLAAYYSLEKLQMWMVSAFAAAVMRFSSFIRFIFRGMVLGQVVPIADLKHVKTEMVVDTSKYSIDTLFTKRDI